MRVKVTIIKDNGEEVELNCPVDSLDSSNVLKSLEQGVLSLQREISPFLSETLIEEHQLHFKGEKNQEKKRD